MKQHPWNQFFNSPKWISAETDKNLLRFFQTNFEGVNFNQGSTKTHNVEDQKTKLVLIETTPSLQEAEIWDWTDFTIKCRATQRDHYFFERLQWQALQKRPQLENQLWQQYKSVILTYLDDKQEKRNIAAVKNDLNKSYIPHHPFLCKKISQLQIVDQKNKKKFIEQRILNGTRLAVQLIFFPVSSLQCGNNCRYRDCVPTSLNQRGGPK